MTRLAALFFIFSTLIVQMGFSQSDGTINRLQATIDSLQLELERCQQSFFNAKPHGEQRQVLIDSLRAKASPALSDVIALVLQVDTFTNFCDQLREELIHRTGGYDHNQMLVEKPNKTEVHQLFLKEQQAQVLRNKMTELRAAMLRLTHDQMKEDEITTGAPLTIVTDQSWEEYTFRHMPTAAVLPLLAKFKADALRDEITTLRYLVEKH